jgi:outer membrane protein assembly factor BamB
MRFLVRRRRIGLGFLVLMGIAMMARDGKASAGTSNDWPGLWGPTRDARAPGAAGFRLAGAARELWRRPIGSGYSGLSVVAGRGYTMHSDGTHDRVVAFDAATGREVWSFQLDATYRGHDGSHDGPISTPTVDGGQVFVVSPRGKLQALETATGKALWQHDLKTDFGAAEPLYGFATSPLVSGGLVLVQVGGEKHNLVAFDRATGKLAWTSSHAQKTGYSSPVLATLAGVPQVIAFTADKVYGVRAEDGKLLWSHPAAEEPSRSPLVLPGDRLLVPYWQDSALLQITTQDGSFTAKELWKKPLLRSTYSPTVYHDGYLYGLNAGQLTCLDPATGEIKWRQKVYAGSLILVDRYLVVLGERSGKLQVIEASPAGFQEKISARVFNPGAASFTAPSFAGGKIFVRNLEEIVALEIAAG